MIYYVILYGLSLALMAFILKWMKWKYLIMDHSIEIYVGLVALFFTGLGVWIATQLNHKKKETVVVEKEVFIPVKEDYKINHTELEKLNLSGREYEVLQLLVKGHSNAEIADQLFLSLSTIKTHVSNIYSKMQVKRRIEATNLAKKLRIV